MNRVLIIALAAGIIGYVAGNTLLFILVAMAGYLGYFLVQLHRLSKWLKSIVNDIGAQPPEGSGLWGLIFDEIYQLQRAQRQASQELQQVLERAQNSAAALDIAVVLIDGNDSLEWWNKAGELLIGLRYPDDQGQNATNLIRDPRFFEYFSEEKYKDPLTIVSPVNNNILLEVQITLFGEHEKLLIVRDITQIHKLELMRKDFVANVSHELRTPITVISGYLESLMENTHLIDGKWHKPLEQMHQQSKRLENIVKDLLMLSRLETRAISLRQETLNVRSLLAEIRNDANNIFKEKRHRITIECEPDLNLSADRSEIYSAISNLVFNAAKYTADEGDILLKGERNGDFVAISIIDNGIGIDPQHIPRLTERFYRVDASRSADTGGTGLGLAIVKHILARHDAKLEIISTPDKGSCFRCKFPVNIAPIQQPGAEIDHSESTSSAS